MIYPWQQTQWQFWQAQLNRVGHAYLLAGASGLGLTEFARQMAKSVFCQSDQPEPCGQCAGCMQFDESTHADFVQLEVLEGKKEVGVDQIRQLTQRLMQTSHQGGYKVAILQEVEWLNASAFNALLKTLEEPAERTLLILTTYQISRLPATIISRCQKMSFTAPPVKQSQAWLAQHGADEQLIKRALRLNWGAPLAALNWLEQKGWEQDESWQNNIQALQSGRESVSQVVTAWLKWPEPERVFDQFYLASVTEIRRAFYQQAELNRNWFQFQQALLQAKQDWRQNANKELLLESLCLLFLQANQVNVPLAEVFQGEWIRGRWA